MVKLVTLTLRTSRDGRPCATVPLTPTERIRLAAGEKLSVKVRLERGLIWIGTGVDMEVALVNVVGFLLFVVLIGAIVAFEAWRALDLHPRYVCPINRVTIRAANRAELRRKVEAHNVYAHGLTAIVKCRDMGG